MSFRIQALAATIAALAAGAAQAAKLDVTAEIDTTFCATGALQCTLAGHSFVEATDLNHNPIRLFVHVARKGGTNASGLPSTSFTFSNGLLPAGGSSAILCSETSCGSSRFGGGAVGAYSIMLDRTGVGTWKAGTYAGVITVTDGTDQGSAMVTFRIPDAGAAAAAASAAVSDGILGTR